LQIGGGIRSYTDSKGKAYSALDVAARYFRAGADKISIGSDAVAAAEAYIARGRVADGSTAIEAIARVYGRQAVVVSVDPRKVYVSSPSDPECVRLGHTVVPVSTPGPNNEGFAWYQCTVKGGREGRPICAVGLAKAVEALGAGELLVNCVDNDGQKNGFDEVLLGAVCAAVQIPVIASSGAGCPAHFESVFAHTRVEAALAAGIFHRREVAISAVKDAVAAAGIETRRVV
jgi:glutamine amidotransferase/cyclase